MNRRGAPNPNPYYGGQKQAPQPIPQMAPPQPPGRSGMGIGVIVLIVMIVLLLVGGGVFAVVAIYGTQSLIAKTEQEEAKTSLHTIGKLAAAVFERDHRICPSASNPVPTAVPAGTKYMSDPSEWEADRGMNAGFACLGFSIPTPQYYQYEYKATAGTFVATARGDVDGNGKFSTFQLEGKLQGGKLVVADDIKETNPDE